MAKEFFNKVLAQRTGQMLLLISIVVGLSSLTRAALLIKSSASLDFTVANLTGIFLIGFLYDIVNAAYVSMPVVLYLCLIPDRLYSRPWHRFVLYGLFFIFTFLLIFNAVSEWLFWDEFNTRFNFIAVDYLVYTTEVIGNIQQSYPIGRIVLLILILALSLVYTLRKKISNSRDNSQPFAKRALLLAIFSAFILLTTLFVTNKQHRFSDNAYVNELAGNGLYELFAAYRNNELDYDQFYKRMDNDKVIDQIHQLIKTSEADFVDLKSKSIDRKIANVGDVKKLNVVLITVESFSADFMALFGNQEKITPFLDSLARHSLLFTNLYATGTRTVRGLEALSLCTPPTPGQSIVRRPRNENLFSLGEVFNEKGYESKFIYGGYGYFDNMNYFFDNNGYMVIDRSAIADDDIDYENIWGVADENLFELALKEIDKTIMAGRPVFAQILTTSNHRPFTYPDGRIDIPSHTNRQGAVKYSDYSIGKFIKEAAQKPWFSNTVFVIAGDHCASSAGKTELPVSKYHIPMLIYAPHHITPGSMDRLMSQIDVGPTLLGLLNFSYKSKFFGYDIFKLEPGRERAFVSTYQKLGYMRNNKLVILSPQQQWEVRKLEGRQMPIVNVLTDEQILTEAIVWYQSASYVFNSGKMKYGR